MSAEKSFIEGRLLKYHSNFYYVESAGVLYECMLRGLIKKEGQEALVGDWVTLDSVNPMNATARIHSIAPRKNQISRPKIANVDQAIVVYSLKEPAFDTTQMDRYLTHVLLANVTPLLCITKMDLMASEAEREAISTIYEQALGYSILYLSQKDPVTLAPVVAQTKNRVTVLAGPSGSGKSSLMNSLNPALQLRTGEISEKISRGQHTTRHVELLAPIPEDNQTWIADTPGFSNLKFSYALPLDIERVFADFAPYRNDCEYTDCLHQDEAGCAVQAYLEAILPSRWESYISFIAEARLFETEQRATSQKEEFGFKTLNRKGKDSVQILRLKGRDRDDSRKRQKQLVHRLDTHEQALSEAETGELAESDWTETLLDSES